MTKLPLLNHNVFTHEHYQNAIDTLEQTMCYLIVAGNQTFAQRKRISPSLAEAIDNLTESKMLINITASDRLRGIEKVLNAAGDNSITFDTAYPMSFVEEFRRTCSKKLAISGIAWLYHSNNKLMGQPYAYNKQGLLVLGVYNSVHSSDSIPVTESDLTPSVNSNSNSD